MGDAGGRAPIGRTTVAESTSRSLVDAVAERTNEGRAHGHTRRFAVDGRPGRPTTGVDRTRPTERGDGDGDARRPAGVRLVPPVLRGDGARRRVRRPSRGAPTVGRGQPR